MNIINEVKAAFPEQKITAFIGGFHIFRHPEAAIRELAKLIKETGIQCIYTGHCSKERGYRILREELGDMARSVLCRNGIRVLAHVLICRIESKCEVLINGERT